MGILYVGCGGILGALARFILSRWVAGKWGGRFPLGTFVINVSGCFLLGFLITGITVSHPSWQLALGTGFLGAYTTFSTFSFETVSLWRAGAGHTGPAYAVFSVTAGLAATWLGILTGQLISNY